MKWTFLAFLSFLLMTMASEETNARKPAVEPVIGLSIDHHQKISPKQDPGFNWQQNQNYKSKKGQKLIKRHKLPGSKPQTLFLREQKKTGASPWLTYLFITILLLLPVSLWYGILAKLRKKHHQKDSSHTLSNLTNTYHLKTERLKRKKMEKEKDSQYPKAS